MAELKWDHGDGEHESYDSIGNHMIFEGPNESHGVQYSLTVNIPTLRAAGDFAQAIENLLDPPECPCQETFHIILAEREDKFCRECGQPLGEP